MERHIRERKEKKALPGLPASAPTISEPLKKTDRSLRNHRIICREISVQKTPETLIKVLRNMGGLQLKICRQQPSLKRGEATIRTIPSI